MDDEVLLPVERMIFAFPNVAHVRKHGPRGYVDYTSFKEWLRDEFTFRCAYCLAREKWEKDGQGNFSVDHFLPRVTDPSLVSDYDNLFYVCLRCNSYKSGRIGSLNPCRDALSDHILLREDGHFEGRTQKGKLHIVLLDLNDPEIVEYRVRILEIVQTALESGNPARIQRWLGFPRNLPDLRSLRPPTNDRPDGVRSCYYELRQIGSLPDRY